MNTIVQEIINGEHDDVFTTDEKNKLIAELVKDSKEIKSAYQIQRAFEGRTDLLNQNVFYNKVA